MDNLMEQIVNITKAGAYDAIAPHLAEVKEQNANFRAGINSVLDEIRKLDPEEFNKDPAAFIIRIGNICNHTLATNRPIY